MNKLNPGEEFLLFLVGLAVVGSLATVATWHRALDWLVAQHVLAAAADSPLLPLPSSGGVGLDAPRLAIASSALALAVVAGVSAARHHLAEESQ